MESVATHSDFLTTELPARYAHSNRLHIVCPIQSLNERCDTVCI